MPPRKAVVKPTERTAPGISPRAPKVPGSSADGLRVDLGTSPIAPDADAELRATLQDGSSASDNVNSEAVGLGAGHVPEGSLSENGDDRIPAMLKGKERLPDEDNGLNHNEPDDANIEVQAQLLADIEFQKELRLRDNENLYEEFLKWREEFAKPYNLPAKRTPSVKIEEILDEEATPAQIKQFEDKKHPEMSPDAVVSDVMANRIAKLSNTSRAVSEKPMDYVDRDSAMGRMLYNEPVVLRPINGRLNIKPIPPTKYKGEMSTRVLMKFFRETRRYMIDGNIPKDRQVDIVTSFVEGSLSTYLERLICDEPEKWRLQDVFIRIYNHVFPLNYRLEQRKKLKNARQNGCRVRKYIDYVEELFDTIGNVDDGSKVTTMWDGFDTVIQKGLYLKGLHPERLSLEDVNEAAEVVELIEGTHRESRNSRKDRRNNTSKNEHSDERRSAFSVEFQQGNSRQPVSKDRKDNGKFKKQNRTLSEAQKNEYRANNQCFSCGQVGHKSRDCPKNTTVKGDKKANTPPGLVSHNLEFELPETMEIVETTVDELSLSVVGFDWYSDVEETYYSSDSDSGSWQDRPNREEDLEVDNVPELEADTSESSDSKGRSDNGQDNESVLQILLEEECDSEKENQKPKPVSLAPNLDKLWAAYTLLTLRTYPATPETDKTAPQDTIESERWCNMLPGWHEAQPPRNCRELPLEKDTLEDRAQRTRHQVQAIWGNRTAISRDHKIKWSLTDSKQHGIRVLDSMAWYTKEKIRGDVEKLKQIRDAEWSKDLFNLDKWVRKPNLSPALTPFKGMGIQTYQIKLETHQQFGYRRKKRAVKLGDPLADRVLEVLNDATYYGDHLFSRKEKREVHDRFLVYVM
ncbi:hypothetical protein PQX77_002671, partial [Marasmius sp. AFHP31]